MTSGGASPRGKQVKCKVLLLDDTMPMFQVSYKAHGCDLFDAVVKHLRLLESDYFGMEYKDATGALRWLDNEKYIVKQTGSQHDMSFRFSVKFYTPDPGLLEEEFTRYLFALQVKRDLASGSMPCNINTAALLSAYIAQAEIGDFNYEEFTDYTYLSSIRFVPNQSDEMEEKIMEHHKNLIGHTPADADYLLLDTARKVETYGVVLHPARDHEGVPLYLSVAHMGVLVFQNNTKINTFSWAKVRKLSFKRKRFLIKLHPEGYDYYKDTVDFFFETRDDCKAFWKKCIEHHAFFRCTNVKRAPRNKTRVVSRGSSFRYSGRTQKQLTDHVRENFVRRPGFERRYSNLYLTKENTTTSVRVSSRSIGAKSNRSATLNSGGASQHSLSSGSHILDDRPKDDDAAAQQPSSRIETVEVHSDSSHSGALAEPGYASINYDRAAEGTPPPLYEEARPLEMNGHDRHFDETEPELESCAVEHEDADDVKQNIEDLYSQVMKPPSRKLSAPDMSHLDHKEEERVVEEEHRLSRSYEVENIPVRVEEREDHLRRTQELEDIPDEFGPPHGNETREEVENSKNLPRCKSESAAESMQVRMYSRPTSLSPHKEAKEESVFETQHHFNNTYEDVDYSVQTTTVTMTTSRSSEADNDRPPTPPPPLMDYQYENHLRERSEENNHVIVTSSSSSEQMVTSLTDQLQVTSVATSPTEETPSKIQFSLGSAGSLPSREGDSGEESHRKRYPTDKAYYIAKELLMTERTYKKDLEVVTVWFQNAMSKDNVMPQYLSSMLFTQLQPIYEFHCSFLREIEQRLAMWEGKSNAHLNGNHQKIGDVVLTNLRGVLHLYQAYISQHGEILTELEQAVKEDRLFEQTYKDFESTKACYLPLVTFLLKPAQRLLHYEIILQRLVNHYSSEHQDYHDCKASLQKIQELTNTFQDKMDELENLHKLIELERDLIGVDGLVQPSRKFLREGCLQKLSRKGYQQRMFFLFSDTLIYTSRTSTPALQFKVHGQLPLRGMIVEETDPKMAVANSFTIYGGNRCLLVAASSQEEKDKWMEDLNDASRAARTQRMEAGIKFQSLRGSTSSTENIDGEEMPPPVEKQIQHRANTTMHVCWHRNTSVSYRDHRKAIKNQLSGYLLRKFKNSSGWQKLWVVFTNFCLFFYKTFQDDFPLASLPLLGYAVSTPGDEDGIHKDYVFKLQFKNHVYFFRAESQYTFERWMEVINSATHNARRMRVFSRMESDTPDRA